jgi:hypothetical protein
LTQLINPQWINNSCGKNKSQKNKSWNPLKNLEELAVYLMHIITTIRWHMDRLEFYFKKL